MGRDIVRSFVSIFGGDVGILLLGVVSTPIIVRVLGSAGYGDYAVVLSVLGITMIFVNAGIFDGIRKYIAERRDESNWQTNVFVFYLRVALVMAAVAAVLLVVATYLGVIERMFGRRFETYFYVVAGIVVTRQVWAVSRGTLMGFGLERYSEPARVLHLLLFLGIGVPLAFYGLGVTGLLFGRLVSMTLVSVGALAFVRRKVGSITLWESPPADFPRRELFSFNAMSVALMLFMTSLYDVDVLLLNLFVDSNTTGFYKSALVVAEFLWFVPGAMQMVLLHSTSELWSEEHVNHISTLASRVTRYSLLFTTLLAIGIAALARDFVPVYFGAEFAPAVTPLLVLLPGAAGFAVTRPILAISQGEGSLRTVVAATGVAALLNVALNVVLIPRYGMLGAGVATSVSYGSMLVLHVWSARRIGFDPLRDLRIGRIAATAVPSAVAVFLLAGAIDGRYLSLVVVPPLGFAVYAFLALATGAIDTQEIYEITDRLPVGRVPFQSAD